MQGRGRGQLQSANSCCHTLKAKLSSFIYFRFLIIISFNFCIFFAVLHFVSCLLVLFTSFVFLQHFGAHFNEFVVNMCVIYLPAPLATWRVAFFAISPRSTMWHARATLLLLTFGAAFYEICASLLIKNCVYLHICSTNRTRLATHRPCSRAQRGPVERLHLSSDTARLFVVCCKMLKNVAPHP